MRLHLAALFVIAVCGTFGDAQILRCRLCNRATRLSDCNKLVSCDSTLEECYLDELITDQLTVVYEGGCRSKDVCRVAGRKREDVVACSGCCSFQDDCNKRLCGIKDDTLNSSQCYSCDHRNSGQSAVTDPKHCVTLDTCQPNEVCYTTQSDVGGAQTFFYGCYSKLVCGVLMHQAFEDYKTCVLNYTLPAGGMSWEQRCGGAIKRSTSLCHSCCADGGCNYGTCKEQNERIFNLAINGKFNMKTLKTQ